MTLCSFPVAKQGEKLDHTNGCFQTHIVRRYGVIPKSKEHMCELKRRAKELSKRVHPYRDEL